MQKITPFLWFDNNAEEAINFYIKTFKDASINNINRRTPDGPLFTGSFTLFGQEYGVINGGPMFKFNEAVSFVVHCKDQEEVDYYWDALTADGGEESMCGWLKDKFGLSWQIIPDRLMELLNHPDADKAQRATQAMLKMKKIDIDILENA
ncbi:MAG: VOC family protein [Flavipsychrobacter sp.]